MAGLPAVLYALQGVLQYVSHSHLDPVTFNGLTQTKTLSAAMCCWIVLGKPQSPLQLLALAILFASALVFQGGYLVLGNYLRVIVLPPQDDDKKKKKNSRPPVSKHATPAKARRQQQQQQQGEDWFVLGVVPCLGAAFLSGLAGALSQKGLQLTGINGRDPFLYTIEISVYSVATLVVHKLMTRTTTTTKPTTTTNNNINNNKTNQVANKSQWTYRTLLPIVVKAAGGVVTALVHKHAGSVAKGFALMFGLVLSGALQESLQPHQIVGTLLIMLSTWLHFTHPTTSS